MPAPPNAGSNAGWILIIRHGKRATTLDGIRWRYPASTTSPASPRAAVSAAASAGGRGKGGLGPPPPPPPRAPPAGRAGDAPGGAAPPGNRRAPRQGPHGL